MLRLPPDDPTPLPARPLPPSYHLDPTKGASYKHFPTIYSALVHNEAVYWDRDRTEDVVRGQIESAWSTVCVIKTTAAGEQELAGWCRVISDGEECVWCVIELERRLLNRLLADLRTWKTLSSYVGRNSLLGTCSSACTDCSRRPAR